jgi:hypothetical protein
VLPDLIRRLVLATTDNPERVAFRSQEGVGIAGWDGLVVAREGSPWVPVGASAWELSVQERPSAKAESDYQKRTKDPEVVDPTTTTFVYATPRPWEQKDEWTEAKRQEGPWLDVRVLDIDDLATWLDHAPTVAVWFAHLIGRLPPDAQDLESFWVDWSGATSPPISTELLAAGRPSQLAAIHAWIREPASTLLLRAETEDEAVAVLAVAVLSLPDNERDTTLARAVVVTETNGWRQLAGQQRPSLLVPLFSDRAETTAAVIRGHHVCVPVGRDSTFGTGVHTEIDLPRIDREGAREVLQSEGLDLRKAATLAEQAHRGIPLLRRQLGLLVQPRWAEPDEARTLVTASLIGRWRDDNEADTLAVGEVASVPYEDYAQELVRWENEQDRPIRRVGTTWLITSREDSWSRLAKFVTPAELERLEAATIRILGERDPSLDLPEETRWTSGVKGMVRVHSPVIREGLAGTLALIGSTGFLYSPPGIDGEAWVCKLVRTLLDGCTDWQSWASLAESLPSIAEACPGSFLDAIEHDLAQTNPLLSMLFTDLSESPHVHLLWALERLAWSSTHLSRVAVALARLARLDPGGRISNRPANSLHEMFRLWRPSTAAPAELRLQVLDGLRNTCPDVTWPLLLALLPAFPETSSPNVEPRWRDWLPPEGTRVTRAELLEGMGAVSERLVADVNEVASRWVQLIPRLDDFAGVHFDAAANSLTQFANTNLDQSDRDSLAGALRRLVAHHAEYPQTEWFMGAEKLERLKGILPQLEDSDPIRGNTWLFAWDTRLPDASGGGWEERVGLVEERRAATVGNISGQRGVEGLLSLARAVDDPWSVGSAAADADLQVPETELLEVILDSTEESLSVMGQGYVAGQTAGGGEAWVRATLESDQAKTWSPGQRGSLLVNLPLGNDTWAFVNAETPETQDEYWRRVPIVGRGQDVPRHVIEETATNLQDHGRYAAAVDLIRLYGADSEVVATALERFAENGPENPYVIDRLAWAVTSLLDSLDESPTVSAERIALLEWVFLGLRQYGDDRPRFLERRLATYPRFFVELLELVFKAEGEEEPRSEEAGTEDAERQRQLARRAMELLSRWSTPPGLSQDGIVDAEAVRQWISEARELAAEVGRQRVGDEYIGQILSKLPDGSDSFPPHEAVRDLFEELRNGDIETGYFMGVLNDRGITSRSLTEGGDQERRIQARFREASLQLRVRWPTASRILGELAARYEHEARDEDVRAQLHDEGIW